MSRSIATTRANSTCSSTTSLLPLTRADGAKATIKLGKERAPLSWQITLMSMTAASYSKLTRIVKGLTKNLIRNLRKKVKRNLLRSLRMNQRKSPRRNLKKNQRKRMTRSLTRKKTRMKIRTKTRRKTRRKTRMRKKSLKRTTTKSQTKRKMRSHLMSLMNNLTSMSCPHQRVKLSTVLSRKRPEQQSIWSVLS